MRFEKWQALGNDYLIVEAGLLPWELTPARVARHCDPPFGRGGDGVLLLSRSEYDAAEPLYREASCGSSTPTAPRPSYRAMEPGRRSSTCAATAGPTKRPSRSAPPPAR